MADKALAGLKVVEYAEMISGPMCGKLFADMGAEVIKVERPGAGDEARRHPPFPDDVPHPEKSGLFLYLNTSKKSVTLDLDHATGVEIFKALIGQADILIENHPPGYMASLGLGWEQLSAINPRLILTSITPFGQSGPYRDWKASDLITWAMSFTGYDTPTMVDHPEQENPLRAPGHQADMMGATNAAASSMTALFHRELIGEGQWIDVPIWQSVVNTSKLEMPSYTYGGVPFSRQRVGTRGGLEPSPCKDGYIYFLAGADAHFDALKAILGNPESLESELFKDMPSRQANADVLRMLELEELAKFDAEYLVREGQARGLTIAPILTIGEAANNPHLQKRGVFVEIDHPVAGRFHYPRALARLSETPAEPLRAPTLGEHNQEIFCDRLGHSPAELAAMRAASII